MDSAVRIDGSAIDGRLSDIGGRIDALMTKAGELKSEFTDVARKELTIWRGLLEELRLQAKLGSMEARDALDPALKHIESLYDATLDQAHQLSRADIADWSDLRTSVERALKDLRREIDA